MTLHTKRLQKVVIDEEHGDYAARQQDDGDKRQFCKILLFLSHGLLHAKVVMKVVTHDHHSGQLPASMNSDYRRCLCRLPAL